MKREDIERACLASLIQFPELFDESMLTTENFANKTNQSVFDAVEGIVADPTFRNDNGSLPLFEIAARSGQDSTKIVQVTRHKIVSIDQARAWFSDMAELSGYEGMTHELKSILSGGTPLLTDLMMKVEQVVKRYDLAIDNVDTRTLSELVLRYEADAKAAKEGRQRVLRVGLSLIDGGMMGLRPGELTTLIGAGGSGKSTLVLFLAKMLAEKGVHSLFFSAEMSATQVAEKSLYAESGINMLSPDPVSIEKLQQGLRAITENFGHRVHVHNKTRVRYSTAVGIAKRLVREKALGVVFFDHLRRMVPEGYQRSQYEKVSAGISQMKDLCREADVPVVVLTHLSRDTKDNPEPTLDLIRDSGQVSEESDHVLGLWRPSEHSTYTWLSLLKSRNTGYKGKVRMHFDPLTQRFREEFG